MLDERVITLRFKEENFLDMELYQSLEKEKKEMGLSMPVYVKEILRQHFENIQQERMNGDLNRCLERMQNMVHEEFVSLNDTITGMIARIPEISSSNIRRTAYEGISLEKEEILPEYSEELPEGMEGVLEQFI
ncbi:MAG: hypothetical protein HFI23_05225 [Lachnospiraceae bacterium]|nr:hypothetical protein [Lachnospiraceae bacterium]